MSGGIFISYRREDSAGFAGRIYDRLVHRLERERVFFDVDNIEPGLDFVKILSDRVGACDALVAIIGKNWLSISGEDNRRRLDDPLDFVRIEIEAALARDIRVIPVLVDGAIMPRQENLPDGLKALARRSGIEISHTRFNTDTERLAKALGFIEEERRKRDGAEAERLQREEREKREAAEAAEKAEEERRKRDAAEAERAFREQREKQEAAEAARKVEEASQREAAEIARRVEETAAQAAAERHRVAEAVAAKKARDERDGLPEAAPSPVDSVSVSPARPNRLASWRVLALVASLVFATAAALIWVEVRPLHDNVLAGVRQPGPGQADVALAAPIPSTTSQSAAGSPSPEAAAPKISPPEATPAPTSVAHPAPIITPSPEASGTPARNAADDPLVKECDQLAASPTDNSRPNGIRGVTVNALVASRAILACRAAMAEFPSVARLQFEFGRALEKSGSYDDAFKLYIQAGNAGYAAAQTATGRLYEIGQGVNRDHEEAMVWYLRAANQGDVNAQFNIGSFYYYAQDYVQAMEWYEKAADQGYAPAQFSIGVFFDKGDVNWRDYTQAMTWYKKAADQGYVGAQYNIGLLYENGEGVKRDFSQARAWYQKAADQGYKDAEAALKRLAAN